MLASAAFKTTDHEHTCHRYAVEGGGVHIPYPMTSAPSCEHLGIHQQIGSVQMQMRQAIWGHGKSLFKLVQVFHLELWNIYC